MDDANENTIQEENFLPTEELAVKKPSAEEKKTIKKHVHGKKYLEKIELIEHKAYTLSEALKVLQESNYVSFDPTVELHFNLSIDPKKSDQLIRKTAILPYGIKKDIKILVFGNDSQLNIAKEAGAAFIGNEETITKIKNGWTGFDKVISSPEMMPKISSLAKILGPKGLMPNIKNNTVTTKISETISQLISGNSIEIKNEKDFPIIHTIIGKLSFGTEKLQSNFKTVFDTVTLAKPTKAKLPYIKALTITTTMGPGIKLDLANLY